MKTYTTTIILETEEMLNNVEWQKCLSDAVERYRQQTGQKIRSVQFGVREIKK